ncbi:unnamed protein product [Lymnaea stagnalis]|uniref:VCBS repeat-containing protein n=1 Tax=Lymnaea stagnalis TaxID=6523 RepID=A0AAV2HYJ0_LYMST
MMALMRLFPLVLLLACIHGAPLLLGKFSYPHAAFSALYPRAGNSGYDLLLTSFGALTSDVSTVADVGNLLGDVTKIKPVSFSHALKWPNEISGVPIRALNSRYVAIPDGFLVPTKTDGSIQLYNLDAPHPTLSTISSGSGSWFYHRVLWVDMNKDGTLDALTCRANKPVIGAARGELVWFTNPPGHSVATPWHENIIAAGPDIFFTVTTFKVGTRSYEAIVVAEFFNPKVSVYWTENARQDWSDKASVRSLVVDSTAGKPFDVLVADINGDHKLDILVTTNSDHNGTVVVYEVPTDFRSGHYTRHLLADGYAVHSLGLNKGGPGSPYLLPGTTSTGRKPSIFIAGDDSAVVSLLVPTSPTDPHSWVYTRNDFLTTGTSTVGGLSFADVDGDGHVELFAPSYDEGHVYVYRL